jgi:hypothetical protein
MSYICKGPIYNLGGKIESVALIEATTVTVDTVNINAATGGDSSITHSGNDLIISNPSTGDIVNKLGDTVGSDSFVVTDSGGTNEWLKVKSDGTTIMSSKTEVITGTGNTLLADKRFVFVDLTGASGTVTATLSSSSIAGHVTTIIVSVDNSQIFDLTITNYVNPGDGGTSPEGHRFSNAGMSITIVSDGTNWHNVNGGTIGVPP